MKREELPVRVSRALRGYSPEGHRTCSEKNFALALIEGGVDSVKLTESYWCTGRNNRNGCKISPYSIEARGGIRVGDEHILWAILHYLHIGFSGCGDHRKGYAQASWLPEAHNAHERDIYFRLLDLPMVVHYFNVLKTLPE